MRVISKPEYLGHPGGVSNHLPALGKESLYFAPTGVDDKGRIYCGPGVLRCPPPTTLWAHVLVFNTLLWALRGVVES